MAHRLPAGRMNQAIGGASSYSSGQGTNCVEISGAGPGRVRGRPDPHCHAPCLRRSGVGSPPK